MAVFAHLLILEYLGHHQNLITTPLPFPPPPPPPQISFQSIDNFVSNVIHKQTNQRHQKHNLLCQRGKYGIVWHTHVQKESRVMYEHIHKYCSLSSTAIVSMHISRTQMQISDWWPVVVKMYWFLNSNSWCWCRDRVFVEQRRAAGNNDGRRKWTVFCE